MSHLLAACMTSAFGVALLAAGPAAAQDGFADPTFGNFTSGFSRIFFDLGGDDQDFANATAVRRDDRILIAGSAQVSSAPFARNAALALLHRDGTADSNFNFSGQLHWDVLSLGLDDSLEAVGELSDGVIVAAGTAFATGISYPIAVLVSPVGVILDERIFGFGDYAGFTALAVQPDDKIVLAGYLDRSTNYAFLVMRLLPDFSRDYSFGNQGGVIIDFDLNPPTYNDDIATAVAVQKDGKILVAGSAEFGNLDTDMAIARLLPSNGALDASFGPNNDGRATVFFDLGPNDKRDTANGVAVDLFGRIVVTGCAQMDAAPTSRAGIARLLSNGDPDTTFGNDGLGRDVFTSLDNVLTCATGVAVQSDAKVLVGGSAFFGAKKFSAARLSTDGSLDSSFGGGFGVVGYNVYYSGAVDDGLAITLENGRALVAGGADVSNMNNDYDFAIMRLESSLIFTDGFENDTTNQWSLALP